MGGHHLIVALVLFLVPLAAVARAGGGASGVDLSTQSGVTCDGTSDSTSGINATLSNNAGKTIFLPPGCVPRLASPGAGNASISVPANTHIYCADKTAGFTVVRHRCAGGDYPDAACASRAECTGTGGSCGYDFGSSIYAPTSGTFTMFKDAAAGGGIWIENCTIWVAQADPYQRCTGTGGKAGNPCRQVCDGAATIPGARCENGTTCNGGAGPSNCLHLSDCGSGGGTGSCGGAPCCAGAPGNPSTSGTAKINLFDFQRTVGVRMTNVDVKDHFSGDFALKTSFGATIEDCNFAQEVSSCTSTASWEPATSFCTGSVQGTCCYGGASLLGTGSNVQPTTAVTDDVVVSSGSVVSNTIARGSTTAVKVDTGLSGGTSVRFDRLTAAPTSSSGPGTAGGGFSATGTANLIETSSATNLASGSSGITIGADGTVQDCKLAGSYMTGISATGAGAHVNGNTLGGTAFATGISLAGARQEAIGNTVTGVNAASAIGISSSGAYNTVGHNYVEGNSTTGEGIQSAGNYGSVFGNQIVSHPADTLSTGISVPASLGVATKIADNSITAMHDANLWIKASRYGIRIIGNTSHLNPSRPTAALKPIHIRLDDGSDSGPSQVTIEANYFFGGWRGISTGLRTNASGLTNTNIQSNRFVALSGAAFVMGGAGVLVQNNYVNGSLGGGPSLVCDASCRGGSLETRGQICFQDSDCIVNGNTCSSTQKCIPEPFAGYVESPTAVMEAAHPVWSGNLLFSSSGTVKQCGGTTSYPGSQCTTAGNACAGEAPTCTGGPPAVCGGTTTEAGALCCPGAAPTCTARTDSPYVRVIDYGVAGTSNVSDFIFAGNNVLPATAGANLVGLDFQSSGSLGNIAAQRILISGNNLSGIGGANSTAIKFPTTSSGIVNVSISGNSFAGWATDVANFTGTMGDLSYVPKTIATAADMTTNSTNFANIQGGSGSTLQVAVDANRAYSFRCDVTFSSANAATGIGLAMTGPRSPTTFTYLTEITQSASSGSDGIITQVGSGDDETAAATLSVPTTGTKYFARINGQLVTGSNAGNLTARVKAGAANNITVYAGSNCLVYQVPR
jgi:hypothetical protein